MSKSLGKISSAKVGFGEEGRFGFWLQFESNDMSVCWQMVYWSPKPSNTSEMLRQIKEHRNVILERIEDTLKSAKKKSVSDLVGVPVEVEFDTVLHLENWRVLTEVL